jgi:hypothetical protein
VMQDLLKAVEVLVEVRRDGGLTRVKAHEVVPQRSQAFSVFYW